MVLVSELDLPSYDHVDASVTGERFHDALGDLAAQSWLARGALGYAGHLRGGVAAAALVRRGLGSRRPA